MAPSVIAAIPALKEVYYAAEDAHGQSGGASAPTWLQPAPAGQRSTCACPRTVLRIRDAAEQVAACIHRITTAHRTAL